MLQTRTCLHPCVLSGHMSTDQLLVKLLTPKAREPTIGSEQSAGYDIYACEKNFIFPHGQKLVKTGIALQPPEGTYLRLASRSGLAYREQITVEAGVIDPDYTGEIFVLLRNSSTTLYRVAEHDRIAQVICEKIARPDIQVVSTLQNTDRGEKGLGSSGP